MAISGWTRRAVVLAVAAAMPITPVSAAPSRSGEVLAPAPPGVARLAFAVDPSLNGIAGNVLDLRSVVAEGTPYTLELLSGRAQVTDLDVWFYRDIQDQNSICPAVPQNDDTRDGRGGESYVFTCDARYAIVVLFTGAAARFHFQWR